VADKNGSIGKIEEIVGNVDCAVDCEGKKLKLIPPSKSAETIAIVIVMTILFFC